MKWFAAILVLAVAPLLAAAQSGGTVDPQTSPETSQPETVNRASSHDRHHNRHKRARHHHRKVAKHRSQRPD